MRALNCWLRGGGGERWKIEICFIWLLKLDGVVDCFSFTYQMMIFSWHRGKCPIYIFLNLSITAFQSCNNILSCWLVHNKKAKVFALQQGLITDTCVMNRATRNLSCLTLYAQINKPNPFSRRTKTCFLFCCAANSLRFWTFISPVWWKIQYTNVLIITICASSVSEVRIGLF